MKFGAKRLKDLTLLSVAGYLFLFAIVAKGVFLYAFQHPPKEELLPVQGAVRKVRLGGEGEATSLRIESDRGIHMYSSYYGKVWPGMKRISLGDQVQVLAERKKYRKGEPFRAKSYYIWELVHHNQVIIGYDDVLNLVKGKEASANRYVNGIVLTTAAFLLVAFLRKLSVSEA